MKIKKTLSSQLIQKTFKTNFGDFHFTENAIISEIKYNATFNLRGAKDVFEAAKSHFGKKSNFFYISNPINNYSVRPFDWVKFYSLNQANISGYAVVAKNDKSWNNTLLEKNLNKTDVQRFFTIKEAINWANESKNK